MDLRIRKDRLKNSDCGLFVVWPQSKVHLNPMKSSQHMSTLLQRWKKDNRKDTYDVAAII